MSDVDPIEAVDLAATGAEMERDPCHREPVAWCSYCRIRAALPALVAMREQAETKRRTRLSDAGEIMFDAAQLPGLPGDLPDEQRHAIRAMLYKAADMTAALRARVRELALVCDEAESFLADGDYGEEPALSDLLARLRAASRGAQP